MALPMDGPERLGKAEPMAPAEEERIAADVAMGGREGGEKKERSMDLGSGTKLN
jgi:hypothetical protein